MDAIRISSPPVREIKFRLDGEQAATIRAWARREMAADPWACRDEEECYRTTSLYFDTPQFDVLRQRGSYSRTKYRVRRYGDGSELFLERKTKRRDVVRKWRTMVPASDLDLLARNDIPMWPGRWFRRRLATRDLRPVCEISYRRLARVGRAADGSPIRLTLDDEVSATSVDRLEFTGRATPLPRIGTILELKYRDQLPELFAGLIAEHKLVAQPSSKYRTAAVALGYGAQLVHA